jgi:hypothetical protein
MYMANKASVKKTAKEIKEEKSKRWLQIGLALLLIFIMIGAVFQVFFSGGPNNGGSTDTGKGKFNSIVDALKDIPQNAKYLRYADLNSSSMVSEWVKSNFYSNIANATLFGAEPRKDVFALYPFPTFGYFDESQQWVLLSDFGPNYDNATFTETTVSGYPMRMITSIFAFSPRTHPVVIGRKEVVATVDSFMEAGTSSQSAYADYSDLIEQASRTNATPDKAQFAVVGSSSSIGFGDRYYAGIAPVNEMTSDYTIVVHTGGPVNETQQQDFRTTYREAALQFGLDSFEPRFTDNYLIIEARGDTIVCLYDMVTNWPGFVQEVQRTPEVQAPTI